MKRYLDMKWAFFLALFSIIAMVGATVELVYGLMKPTEAVVYITINLFCAAFWINEFMNLRKSPD